LTCASHHINEAAVMEKERSGNIEPSFRCG
jgi:hypothetical protein